MLNVLWTVNFSESISYSSAVSESLKCFIKCGKVCVC